MKETEHDPHIAERRAKILDAAAKVFAAKGFHPTTIRDIAREAGIADGTIYNYFENKPALLLGTLERMAAIARQDAPVPASPPLDIRTFMRAFIWHPVMALKADNFALFRVVISEIMVNAELRAMYYSKVLEPTLAMGEDIFQQWAAQRAIKVTDVQLAVRVVSSLMFGLMLEYVMGDPTLQSRWDELPDFLTDMLLNGLRSDQP